MSAEPDISSLFHGGRLLETVQLSSVYEDSKTFVDSPARQSPAALLTAFDALPVGDAPALASFLETHFSAPGQSLATCTPSDWSPAGPQWFADLPAEAEQLARAAHARWPLLCRSSADSLHSHATTALPLPHPCFVPGDRFREAYYWDTLWIVRGLLACEMRDSATGCVKNLLHLLQQHGFVPNGARSYYLNRSQPPLLSRMVMELHSAGCGGVEVLELALPLLCREWQFWTSGAHAVRVRGCSGAVHALSRYCAAWDAPRPESFREDHALAAPLPPSQQTQLWRHIASAAESGWDFSSRWLHPNATYDHASQTALAHAMRTMRTTRILPADLNALLLAMARDIAHIAALLGDRHTEQRFSALAAQRAAAVRDVLWDPSGAQWQDFELEEEPLLLEEGGEGGEDGTPCAGRPSTRVFASNWVPLWCGAADAGSAEACAAVASLRGSGLLLPGGCACSTQHTGCQWDYPNAWPPLQHMLAEGCAAYGASDGLRVAQTLASRFLSSAAAGLQRSAQFHEKYDARGAQGAAGQGGEYAPQVGFGWTNGAALAFLRHYARIPTQE